MNEDFNHIKACLRQILLTTEPNDPETVLHVMTKYVVQMPEDLRFRAGKFTFTDVTAQLAICHD